MNLEQVTSVDSIVIEPISYSNSQTFDGLFVKTNDAPNTWKAGFGLESNVGGTPSVAIHGPTTTADVASKVWEMAGSSQSRQSWFMNDNEIMRLTNGGDLLLSESSITGNPADKLHVIDSVPALRLEDSTDSSYGRFRYDFSSLLWDINGSEIMRATGGKLLIGTSTPLGAEAGSITISTGDSGAGVATTGSDDLVIESDGTCGLTFLSPNTSSSYFAWGDPDNTGVGWVGYEHTTDEMVFGTNGAERLSLNASGLLTAIDIEVFSGTPIVRLRDTLDGTGRFQFMNNAGTTQADVRYDFVSEEIQMWYYPTSKELLNVTKSGTLHLPGTVDTSLSSDGLLVLGPTTGVNMSLDANEIQARNNGSASTLYLNFANGNIVLGTSSSNTTISGKFGVGTTTPLGKVQIEGGTNTQPGLYLSGGTADIAWTDGELLQIGQWN